MEAVYFTSFGLLMSLLLRKQSKRLKISAAQYNIIIDNKRKMEEEEYEEK